jgi:hypothetical protein
MEATEDDSRKKCDTHENGYGKAEHLKNKKKRWKKPSIRNLLGDRTEGGEPDKCAEDSWFGGTQVGPS